MQDIEPHYGWRDEYRGEDDPNSPFYGMEYSEFEYTNKVYNYLLHPQWDHFGSDTLLIKILFVEYDDGYAIIEFIGEWNDCINNDIMFLKRDIIDEFIELGIDKFIFIGENVLNFHGSDDSYYEELAEDLEGGWVIMLNFLDHVAGEMESHGIGQHVLFENDNIVSHDWRSRKPDQVYELLTSNQFSIEG